MTRLDNVARRLVGAWGCWAPSLTADGRRTAYISDRTGIPALWVGDTGSVHGADPDQHRRIVLSDDPVLRAQWSPDGQWIACAVASGGGVRSEVWVVRPDGTGARRVAGGHAHATLGPWAPKGHRLVVNVYDGSGGLDHCRLLDVGTAAAEELTSGSLLEVLDLSADERFLLLLDGPRSAQRCRLLDRHTGHTEELLPFPSTGSTEQGILRPGTTAGGERFVAYLVTDAGLPRRGLVGVPIGPGGHRNQVGVLAQRGDAELELVDGDREGRTLLLVWNAGGTSEIELIDTASQMRRPVDGMPGSVVQGGVLSRDGTRAVFSVESPVRPRQLFVLGLRDRGWEAVTAPSLNVEGLVVPTSEHFESHDGLPIQGWLYPPISSGAPGAGPPPALVYVHGGPETQERPTFNPQHQLLAAAGMAVFALNIRGSTGYGRYFVHADERFGRLDAIADVAAGADYLASRGLAHPWRIAVAGRSYGGYVALMALALYAARFASGIDVCGMSDLRTFYRDTEPWIAEAAVTKYGHPQRDARMLAGLSPMHHVDDLRAPVLVVHGELDTNVPLNEGRQLVAALRRLGRPVEYLELAGEGHDYRRVDSRLAVLQTVLSFLQRTLAVTSEVAS